MRISALPLALCLLFLAGGCRTPAPDACVVAPPSAAGATGATWGSIELCPAAGPENEVAVAAGWARLGFDGPGGGRVEILEARTGRLLFSLPGSNRGNAFGWSVAATPAPGRGLLLVGSPAQWDSSGAVYVFSCRDGSEVGILKGPEDAEDFGRSVAWIGDIDGDGTADIAVGASGAGLPGGGTHAGAVFTYSGASLKPLWQARAAGPYERFGVSIRGCTDLDGDGVRDLAIGSEGFGFGEGGRSRSVVTALSGATGTRIWRTEREARAAVSIVEIETCRDRDGDGVEDLVVHRWKGPGTGERRSVLEVLSGATGVLLPPDDEFPWICPRGERIALLGDRDGDGIPERVRQDNHATPGSVPHSRATYLPSRSPPASLCAEGWDALHGFLLDATGGRAKDGGIATVANVGDLLVLLSPEDGRVLWTRRAGEEVAERPPAPEEPGELVELRGLLDEVEGDLTEVGRALSAGQKDRAREAGMRAEGGLRRAESLVETVRERLREAGDHPVPGMAFQGERAKLVRLHDCWILLKEEFR